MAADIGAKVKIDGYAQVKSEIQNITQQQKTLKSEMQAVSSAWDKNTSAEKKNAEQKRILNQQIEAQEQKVQKLQEVMEKTAEKYGENSREANSWKEKLNQATAELNGLKSQLDALPSGVDLLSQKFKDSGEKISAAGEKIKGVGEGMTKYITAPIAAIGAASIAAFNDVDTGLDTIITKTGASGEALESMQKSMEDIATTIPTGFEEAGAAVGEVNTRFGIMGDDLTDLSGQFIKFAQLNGTDVSGSIDKVQASMAAFDLDASKAGDVLDILNKAGQDTGISMDTLASALTANGTALQEAGFSFEQSAGFLANLNKNGLDSGAVMSGLKKALQNATKEGKPLDKALADLQKSLKNAKNDTEAMQIATELFGAKAGPQLAAAIQEGRISLDASANSIKDWGDSVSTTFDATLDAPDKFKVTMNELKLVGADLGGTLLEMLVPALQKLSEIVHSAREAWNGLDEGQKQAIITIAGVVAAIGPAVTIIGTVISTVGAVIGAVGGLISTVGAIAPVVGAAVAAFGPFIAIGAGVVAAGVAIYKNWDTIKEKAAELDEAIKTKFEEIKNAAQENWEAVKQKTSEVWDAAKQKVSEAGSVMLTDVNTALANIQAAYETNGGGISGAAAAIMTAVEEAFTTGYDVLNSLTDGKFGEICNTFNTLTGGLLDKVQEVWEGIKGAVQAGVDKLKELMNFEWKLPKLELPHFKISGTFSLNPPSVPSIGVDWYAKAMQNGMILNNPTIFGAQNGRLLGAGEAGPEVVVGAGSLSRMIQSAVNNTYNTGGNVINVYGAPGQDVRELAHEVADIINGDVQSKGAVWA